MPASNESPASALPTRWFKEPLLHFLVLGGLLFAVDHRLHERIGDPHIIVVGPEVNRESIALFRQAHGREPDRAELTALDQAWIDNEVLYRESLAMRLDQGDETIRDRLIARALSAIDGTLKLPEADDRTLRDWFQQHRDKYDAPERYDFEEGARAGTSGDAQAGIRVFRGQTPADLERRYGPDFPTALARTKFNERTTLPTRDGLCAIRLTARSPATAAAFEDCREAVLRDWKTAMASEQRALAIRAAANKYRIEIAPPARGEQ